MQLFCSIYSNSRKGTNNRRVSNSRGWAMRLINAQASAVPQGMDLRAHYRRMLLKGTLSLGIGYRERTQWVKIVRIAFNTECGLSSLFISAREDCLFEFVCRDSLDAISCATEGFAANIFSR